MNITIADEIVQLLPERAVFWPRQRALFVADLHAGKAAAFRAHGLAVPEGNLADDLNRLTQVIAQVGAQRVFILGDLLHAAQGMTAQVIAQVAAWRRNHADCQFIVVRGNHDRRAGDLPPEWGMDCVDEPCLEAPFVLRHAPGPSKDGYALAGHLHPAVMLRGRGKLRARLPCFVVSSQQMILPAFGGFTGMALIRPQAGERIYAIADQTVILINDQATRTRNDCNP
jgi:DNA ligase-associated metallophosphoesterase